MICDYINDKDIDLIPIIILNLQKFVLQVDELTSCLWYMIYNIEREVLSIFRKTDKIKWMG